jgi:ubiquinone biosynthesis protein COQ9
MSTPDPATLTNDQLKPMLVEAMLAHVPFDGWGPKALAAAAADLGVPTERARLCFPGGPGKMVAAYLAFADARMLAELDRRGLHNLKIREKITTAVRTRLEAAATEREAVRRALSVLAWPGNAALAAKSLAGTVDAMWRAAGDTATDFNFYTKRATLAAVYSSTLMVWLNDDSEGLADTWAFLDRRIADVMKIEKTKAQWRKGKETRPSLVRFLGRLRYGAVN